MRLNDCELVEFGGVFKVGGNFYCYNNKLTSLLGCPIEVGSSFNCDNNKLSSLVVFLLDLV